MDNEMKKAERNSISATTPKGPSELDRLSGEISTTEELVAMLADRLQNVMHSVPTEDSDRAMPGGNHLSSLGDRVNLTNANIRYILERLVI